MNDKYISRKLSMDLEKLLMIPLIILLVFFIVCHFSKRNVSPEEKKMVYILAERKTLADEILDDISSYSREQSSQIQTLYNKARSVNNATIEEYKFCLNNKTDNLSDVFKHFKASFDDYNKLKSYKENMNKEDTTKRLHASRHFFTDNLSINPKEIIDAPYKRSISQVNLLIWKPFPNLCDNIRNQ